MALRIKQKDLRNESSPDFMKAKVGIQGDWTESEFSEDDNISGADNFEVMPA